MSRKPGGVSKSSAGNAEILRRFTDLIPLVIQRWLGEIRQELTAIPNPPDQDAEEAAGPVLDFLTQIAQSLSSTDGQRRSHPKIETSSPQMSKLAEYPLDQALAEYRI